MYVAFDHLQHCPRYIRDANGLEQVQKPSEQSKKWDDTSSAVKACLPLMMLHLQINKGLDDNITADVPEHSTNDVQNDASTTDVLAEEYARVENSATNVKV